MHTLTKKILEAYETELMICTKLPTEVIKKIVYLYLDSRIICASCNLVFDKYNFLSHCDYCKVMFCSSCSEMETTFVKYNICNVTNCYSCLSGLICENETSTSYCIPCKNEFNINNACIK